MYMVASYPGSAGRAWERGYVHGTIHYTKSVERIVCSVDLDSNTQLDGQITQTLGDIQKVETKQIQLK